MYFSTIEESPNKEDNNNNNTKYNIIIIIIVLMDVGLRTVGPPRAEYWWASMGYQFLEFSG